ncbi:MAG: SDR family oxidoreductase [Actinomycetota bacterium]|nr:SDR family oxidoreductase [Actinomycetota bacterium]
MTYNFRDKIAVVTGASSGVGAAAARALAEAGADVVVVGRDRDRLAWTAKAVEATGRRVELVCGDLADDGTLEAATSTAAGLGGVDALLHCAALFETGNLAAAEVTSIDRMWRVNARAPMLLTRALLPHLHDGAAIVFCSSTVAHKGFPGCAAYSATKGAIEAFSRALAIELAPRVRVNVLAPGFIDTPMLTNQYAEAPQLGAWVTEQTPLKFIGSAEDLAQSLLMLACPEASRYITGTTLICDGGWVARG